MWRRAWFVFCVLAIAAVGVYVDNVERWSAEKRVLVFVGSAVVVSFLYALIAGGLGRIEILWRARRATEFVGGDSQTARIVGANDRLYDSSEFVFVRAVIRNRSKRHPLTGLNADVRFFHPDGGLVLRMEGRWADYKRHGSDRPEVIDLHPGGRALLDIAMRGLGDGGLSRDTGEMIPADMFAYNTENLERSRDLRLEAHKLTDTDYKVVVDLTGGGIGQSHALHLQSGSNGEVRDYGDPYIERWKQ